MTVMVAKVGLTYTSLFMPYMDVHMNDQSKLKYDLNLHKYLLENQKRYLDDCLVLWAFTLQQLINLKNLIDRINKEITFTMEYSKSHLPFMDIVIIESDKVIQTDIHCKQTNSKQYLLFSLRHSKQAKKNIPFHRLRRICTIFSNFEAHNKRLQEVKQILLKIKYPLMLIHNGIKRAKIVNIEELRKTQQIDYISTQKVCIVIHQDIPLLKQN